MAKDIIPAWLQQALQRNGYTIPIRSVMDFMKVFRDDEKCMQYLVNLKWHDTGWQCPKCGHKEYTFITTRKLLRCKKCHYDESFIVNTVMQKTRKPLSNWFWTIYTIATDKTGISAMELYRQMDFGSYVTAWAWLHKIRMAMIEEDRTPLMGSVEVDETYVFTGTAGKGRMMKGEKAIIICAVEIIRGNTKKIVSGRIRLRAIPSARREDIIPFIEDHVAKGSTIYTDGWSGYKGISRLGYVHIVKQIDKPEEASKKFPRVHRVFSNLKSWLIGTHRFVSKKHLQNYLNEYIYRFNSRRDPIGAFNTVLKSAIFTPARTFDEFIKPKQPIYTNPISGELSE